MHRREPYLNTSSSKDIFLDSFELARKRYNFEVLGYVVISIHAKNGSPFSSRRIIWSSSAICAVDHIQQGSVACLK
jgi:hypothetical protein